MHVNAATGDIFLTALTKLFDFMAAGKDGGRSGILPAVEVFRVREDKKKRCVEGVDPGRGFLKDRAEALTGLVERSGGKRYTSERVFGDSGEVVMGSTAAAPYQDKLLLTGASSRFSVAESGRADTSPRVALQVSSRRTSLCARSSNEFCVRAPIKTLVCPKGLPSCCLLYTSPSPRDS